MARPHCCRRISREPASPRFGPPGRAAHGRGGIVLALDEFEAIRLADFEGLYQEEGATRMGVSRPTFGRILASARRKVARALVAGEGLRIEGGNVEMRGGRRRCRHELEKDGRRKKEEE